LPGSCVETGLPEVWETSALVAEAVGV